MSWSHIHTLVNHFPIILSVVGIVVLLIAVVARRRALWLYALATLTMAGVSVYPATFTGKNAAFELRTAWYVERGSIHEHESAADFALPAMLLVGAISGYAWWRMLSRPGEILPPVWLRVVTAVVAVWSCSVVARTAYLGGKIVHESPALLREPVGKE